MWIHFFSQYGKYQKVGLWNNIIKDREQIQVITIIGRWNIIIGKWKIIGILGGWKIIGIIGKRKIIESIGK